MVFRLDKNARKHKFLNSESQIIILERKGFRFLAFDFTALVIPNL